MSRTPRPSTRGDGRRGRVRTKPQDADRHDGRAQGHEQARAEPRGQLAEAGGQQHQEQGAGDAGDAGRLLVIAERPDQEDPLERERHVQRAVDHQRRDVRDGEVARPEQLRRHQGVGAVQHHERQRDGGGGADRERCPDTSRHDVPRHHNVPSAGIEPATPGLGNRCVQLPLSDTTSSKGACPQQLQGSDTGAARRGCSFGAIFAFKICRTRVYHSSVDAKGRSLRPHAPPCTEWEGVVKTVRAVAPQVPRF